MADELLEVDAFDGQKKTILNFTAPVLDDNGQIEAAIVVNRDVTELKRAEAAQEKLINDLQKALSEVGKLSGMLPICAKCKKIRDDTGYWNQVEAYIASHSDVQFSHSICPECAKKLYPEYYDVMYPEERGSRNAERGTGEEEEDK